MTELMKGEKEAREELQDDSELKLYVTEVGLFDMDDDPNTAYDTVEVMTASFNYQSATVDAINYCEDNEPVVGSVSFAPMDFASEYFE